MMKALLRIIPKHYLYGGLILLVVGAFIALNIWMNQRCKNIALKENAGKGIANAEIIANRPDNAIKLLRSGKF